MLVFDRPSIFPSYPGISILQSTIQPPLYPLIMHNSLVAGRKTRGYIRYSPAFISFTVLPDRPLQSTLESRSRRSPEERSTTSSFPVDQEYLGGSQAGGLAFSIVLCLC